MSRQFNQARFVSDGMTVWAPWERFCPVEKQVEARTKGQALRCVVSIAAGNHARIVNAEYGVDAWISVDDLFVRSTDV